LVLSPWVVRNMGGASSFYAMLFIATFLMAIWVAGRLSRLLGVSSIVLEVGVGLVLGPSVLNLIPKELSWSNADLSIDCSTLKDQMYVAKKGYEYCDIAAYIKAGKYLTKNDDNGTYVEGFFEQYYAKNPQYKPKDFDTKRKVTLHGHDYCIPLPGHTGDGECGGASAGKHRRLAGSAKGQTKFNDYQSCLIDNCDLKKALKTATIPDIFTLTGHTGVALMIFESGMHFDFEQAKAVGPWASLVAVLGTLLPIVSGVALAIGFGFPLFPDAMSCGVALAPTSVGIALKLLHEAHALEFYFGQAVMTAAFIDDVLSLVIFSILFSVGDDMSVMTFLPLIFGLVFMAVAIVAAVKVWPGVIQFILDHVPETKAHMKLTRHDEVMWLLMFITLVAYSQITHMCGTHLWGCFIAGMSFATRHEAHHVWVRQVKRNTCWFLRIFFAATLAWSIPVDTLFSLSAFWKGSLMGIGPCILTKVICGPFMGDSRWVIGWAMVGRAEFAYFIGIMAKSMKMMSDELFAILVWALIYATIFAPLIFKKVLDRYMSKFQTQDQPKVKTCATGHLPDLYAEELEREEEETRIRAQQLEVEVAAKDQEIQRLKAQLGLPATSVQPTKVAPGDDAGTSPFVGSSPKPDTLGNPRRRTSSLGKKV